MGLIMPEHVANVREHPAGGQPLFAKHGVESYLASMFNPTVQLKSGGYIVIGVTEALVAIDVNSGRATKKGSVEETALETNLEAAEEIARQLRLRDLAGLIVIDFIDMEERKNNAAVEKRFKDKLKTDRARIQVGRISGFGLLEMSRQRLRPGMLEATTQPCPACHGTGLLRSDDSLGLQILRQIEEEGVRGKSREVTVRCPVAIANFLMNQKREHIAQIEARYGLSVRIEGDGMMISPDFTIDRSKTATRAVPEPSAPVISVDTSDMPEMPDEDEAEEARQDEAKAPPQEGAADEGGPKKKRRRRRRRGRSSGSGEQQSAEGQGDEAQDGGAQEGGARDRDGQDAGSAGAEVGSAVAGEDSATGPVTADAMPAPEKAAGAGETEAGGAAEPQDEAPAEEKPKRTRVRRTSRGRKSKAADGEASAETGAAEAPAEPAPATDAAAAAHEAKAPEPEPESMPEPAPQTELASAAAPQEPVADEPATADEPAGKEPAGGAARERELATAGDAPGARGEDEPKPKKRGWWSFGR
jgi:ribonuclease E